MSVRRSPFSSRLLGCHKHGELSFFNPIIPHFRNNINENKYTANTEIIMATRFKDLTEYLEQPCDRRAVGKFAGSPSQLYSIPQGNC